MRLLGLELSDAGIMLAGSDPVQLLEIEGTERESPGYAFSQEKHSRGSPVPFRQFQAAEQDQTRPA